MSDTFPTFYNPWMQAHGSMIPNWLLRRKEVSAEAKIIYARLCQYAGQRGVAYPRRETIAEEVGLALRTAERYIAELCDLGLILKVRRGMHQANRYMFIDHPWRHEFPPDTDSPYDDDPLPEEPDSIPLETPFPIPFPPPVSPRKARETSTRIGDFGVATVGESKPPNAISGDSRLATVGESKAAGVVDSNEEIQSEEIQSEENQLGGEVKVCADQGFVRHKPPKPRGCRLPPDFAVPAEEAGKMVSRYGFTPAQIESITESFRDYWTANGKCMVDWVACWRNWVRNEVRFRGPGGKQKQAAWEPRRRTMQELTRSFASIADPEDGPMQGVAS